MELRAFRLTADGAPEPVEPEVALQRRDEGADADSFWIDIERPERDGGGELLDRLKLRMFYLRDIFVQLYLVQSLRVMGLSLGNGVSVMDTLASCRDVVQNRLYRRFISQVEVKVQEGEGLAAAFEETEFIPPAVRQMISTGEETGNLPRVMSRVAAYYERELDKRMAAFARAVEPIMLIVMGAVVGLVVSSLILPIFKLSRAVG